MYALINNNAVVKYPYSIREFCLDNLNISFPVGVESRPEILSEFGLFPVYQTTISIPLDKVANEGTPVKINDVWTQTWTLADATASQIQAKKLQLQTSIVAATQLRLDTFAQTRNYDGILSACTYATSPTAKFATEGQYCVTQRDATWAKLYQILGEVEAGTRPMPDSYASIESLLPSLSWPL
jgi:hypothetical protein